MEESPKKLRDVLLVTYRLRHKKELQLDSPEYYQLREEVLIQERCVLQTIAFDLTVEHPYKYVLSIVKEHFHQDKVLAQYAWNFVNDRYSLTCMYIFSLLCFLTTISTLG